VPAADGQVRRDQLLRRLALRQVEAQGGPRERRREVQVGGGEAGGVEERCEGADGFGRVAWVARAARVVLGAAADGDVLESDAGGGWWEAG
jgi:hypothetical protein